MENDDLKHPDYDPNGFIDWLREALRAKSDAHLGRKLGVDAPYVSRVRHGLRPVGASLLIAIHEETGLHVREIKKRMYRIAEVA